MNRQHELRALGVDYDFERAENILTRRGWYDAAMQEPGWVPSDDPFLERRSIHAR